jgi:ABC-type transporter Mla subunit MlaD
MSQAVIDFCESLKSVLLALEERLDRAKSSLEAGATQVSAEARKHIEDAAEQLDAFRAQAGRMAQAIRAELPDQAASVKEKLTDFGQEAQVALRHAAVFLAETAAKGAESAAGALKDGAAKANDVAADLRRDTAVAIVAPEQAPPPA